MPETAKTLSRIASGSVAIGHVGRDDERSLTAGVRDLVGGLRDVQSRHLVDWIGRGSFQIRSGRLVLDDRNDVLEKHLAAAIWPELAADAVALRPIIVARNSERPLIFHAIRRRGHLTQFRDAGLYHLHRSRRKVSKRHRSLWGALQIVATAAADREPDRRTTRSPGPDIAESLERSHETVRSHAKSLYAKTDTSSHGEIADPILRFAPLIA